MSFSGHFQTWVSNGCMDMDEMIEEEFMLYLLNKNPNAFVNSHDYAQEPVKKRRFRHRMKVIDFWQTPWGRMLRHDGLKDEYSYQSRKFRRRFRLPHQVFERLTQDCKEKEIFKVSGSRIPVELKVLACLRILGRDACCDDIEEMSEIAESTVNAVFKQFVTGCVAKLFESYVNVPVDDELQTIKETYARLGFPGCVGSMDCTHVPWAMCPVSLTHQCTGKEGYPTLAFQVMVDHSRKIHHVSKVFWGATSDKNITLNDTFPVDLLSRELYKSETFYTFNCDNGQRTQWSGAYILVDGGYQHVAVFIDPIHDRFGMKEVLFSEWLESARKDVECTFGVFKARWRFFRNPIRYHSPQLIEAAFQTVCMLHNMILSSDGLDVMDWDSIDPDSEEPLSAADDMEWREPDAVIAEVNEPPHLVPANEVEDDQGVEYDMAALGQQLGADGAVVSRIVAYCTNKAQCELFKPALVDHFNYLYMRGLIQWPRRMTNQQREAIKQGVPQALAEAVEQQVAPYVGNTQERRRAASQRAAQEPQQQEAVLEQQAPAHLCALPQLQQRRQCGRPLARFSLV